MLDTISVIIMTIFTILAFMRGAIREIFGLAGMIISIMITMDYSEFFMDMFNFRSMAVNLLVSSGLVYLVSLILMMTLSSWIIHLLRPICLTPGDRFSGIFVGFIKGFFLAYILFLGIELTYYSFSHKDAEDKEVLPGWVLKARLYPIFSYIEENMDDVIPDSFYEKIKIVGADIQESLRYKQARDLDGEKDGGKDGIAEKNKKPSGLFSKDLE